MACEENETHALAGVSFSSSTDPPIAALASKQHGLVSGRQLHRIGLTPRAVSHRLECGRLHRIHRGVYAVGHSALTQRSLWMAAILWVGPDAVLSHQSAALLEDLLPPWTKRGLIHVTCPRRVPSLPSIRMHRARLEPSETATTHRIPVTAVPRTLLDLAATTDLRTTKRALARAGKRLGSLRTVREICGRRQGERGTARLREALATYRGPAVTRSEFEERFREVVAEAGLPAPISNVRIRTPAGVFESDTAWPSARLVAELDGYDTHSGPLAFRDDRRRDRALGRVGWRVIRYTWDDLDAPAELVAELRDFLSDG